MAGRLALLGSWVMAAVACTAATPQPASPQPPSPASVPIAAPATPPAFDREAFAIETVTHYPCSLGGSEHQTAMQWAIDHPERSHAALLEAITRGDAPNLRAVALVLAAIGRPESVPVLEHEFRANGELRSGDAALGLVRHPHASARAALLAGLAEPAGRFTRMAAADVLGDPAQHDACPALLAQAEAEDEQVRYHVLQAIGHARCLPAAQWRARTRGDRSADIRDLPRKLAHAR